MYNINYLQVDTRLVRYKKSINKNLELKVKVIDVKCQNI